MVGSVNNHVLARHGVVISINLRKRSKGRQIMGAAKIIAKKIISESVGFVFGAIFLAAAHFAFQWLLS